MLDREELKPKKLDGSPALRRRRGLNRLWFRAYQFPDARGARRQAKTGRCISVRGTSPIFQ